MAAIGRLLIIVIGTIVFIVSVVSSANINYKLLGEYYGCYQTADEFKVESMNSAFNLKAAILFKYVSITAEFIQHIDSENMTDDFEIKRNEALITLDGLLNFGTNNFCIYAGLCLPSIKAQFDNLGQTETQEITELFILLGAKVMIPLGKSGLSINGNFDYGGDLGDHDEEINSANPDEYADNLTYIRRQSGSVGLRYSFPGTYFGILLGYRYRSFIYKSDTLAEIPYEIDSFIDHGAYIGIGFIF